MNRQFLILPSEVNQAFESNNSSGGGQGDGITRRSFLKRTGGATVATLAAWNLQGTTVKAEGEGDSGSGSGSGSLFLVCTVAPSADQKDPPVSNDTKVYTLNNFRKKGDHLICAGPALGDSKPATDEASFEMTAHLLTTFEQFVSGASSGTTLRESTITEEVVVTGGNIVWRTPAVAGNIKSSNGGSGSISNSGASGGVGIQAGTVNAKTIWAEPGYAGVIGFRISQSGTMVTVNPNGAFGSNPMEWEATQVQWQFELMTQTQLDAFLIAHWNEIHNTEY